MSTLLLSHADKANAVLESQRGKRQVAGAASVEMRRRAERKLGDIIEEHRKAGKLSKGTRGSRVKGARVDKKPTLATQGIDKNLADRARKVAAKVVVAARFLGVGEKPARKEAIPSQGLYMLAAVIIMQSAAYLHGLQGADLESIVRGLPPRVQLRRQSQSVAGRKHRL